MENLRFRTGAKIVAIVDLVLTAIMLWLLAMIFFIVVGYFSAPASMGTLHKDLDQTDDDDPDTWDKDRKAYMGIALVLIFVFALVLEILELVAAIKLLNSTQLGADFAESSKKARFWKYVTIVFVAFAIFGLIVRGMTGSLLGISALILRLIGIFVVHNFIKELDVAATLPRTHIVYNVTSGGMDGRGFAIPPGSVILTMNPQQQTGLYPNLATSSGMYPDQSMPPKYADVVEKR